MDTPLSTENVEDTDNWRDEDSTTDEVDRKKPIGFTFESHGLQIESRYFPSRDDFPIPQDARVAKMDFIPNHKSYYVASERSSSIAMSIEGFQKFFDFLDFLRLKKLDTLIPDYLVGETNERMAKFAQRIGFQINQIDSVYWRVYGETNHVYETYMQQREALEKKGVLKKLEGRAPEVKAKSDEYKPGLTTLVAQIPFELYLGKKLVSASNPAKKLIFSTLSVLNGGATLQTIYHLLPQRIRNQLKRRGIIGQQVQRDGYSYTLY